MAHHVPAVEENSGNVSSVLIDHTESLLKDLVIATMRLQTFPQKFEQSSHSLDQQQLLDATLRDRHELYLDNGAHRTRTLQTHMKQTGARSLWGHHRLSGVPSV